MGKGQFLRSPIGIVIVLVVLLVMVGVMSSQGGVLNEIAKDFDKFFGKKDVTVADYNKARASMDALVCAINAVEKGDENLCKGIDFYASVTQSSTGMSTAIYGPMVECEVQGTSTSTGKKQITCEVINFDLPETFAGLFDKGKDFINAAGDPSFLVYYQIFPMSGESADWESHSEWFTGISKIMWASMCVMDVFAKPLSRVKAATKDFIKSGVSKAINKVKTKFKDFAKISSKTETAAVRTLEEEATVLLQKVSGREILDFWKTQNLNDAIVTYFKTGPYAGKGAIESFNDLIAKSGKTFANQAEREAYQLTWQQAWLGKPAVGADLTNILTTVQKAEPGILRNLFSETLQKAKNPEVLQKFAKYVGVDYGISYFAARFDSEIGKFIKEHPGSMVLGMPCVREEEKKVDIKAVPPAPQIDYPNKQNLVQLGKPVILVKKEWKNQPVPFYLASPCNATVLVESKPMKCGIYNYDLSTGMTTCLSPDKDTEPGWFNKLFGSKDLPECGSILDVGSLGKKNMYERFKDKVVAIVKDINSAKVNEGVWEVNGNDRIKIVDPINDIRYYYDKNNKVIDYIGGKFGTETTTVYKDEAHNVKYYLDIVQADMGDDEGCFYINSKNDGRLLCFLGRWDEEIDILIGTEWVKDPPLIINTNTGKGFNCIDREVGKFEYESKYGSDSIVKEDKVEEYVIGDSMGKKYTVCPLSYVKEGLFKTWTKIFFDGDTGEFYGIYISTREEGAARRWDFFFSDSNYDGKIDYYGQHLLDLTTFGHTSTDYGQALENPELYFQYRVFSDNNFNGDVDEVRSTNCVVPEAFAITPDKMGKDEFGHNYCYRSRSGIWNVATTVAIFGAGAFAKTGAGVVASAVVSCGIAVIEFVWDPAQSNWPEG